MTRYFLKLTGKEVNLGDTIEIVSNTTTDYGEGTLHTKITLTEKIIPKLISDGLIEIKTDFNMEVPAIIMAVYREIAKDSGIGLFKIMRTFSLLRNISKKAYLTALIETIANKKNKGKKLGDKVYWLMPSLGYKPFPITGKIPKGVVVFVEEEDAIKAYQLLKPVIKELFNEEQKD